MGRVLFCALHIWLQLLGWCSGTYQYRSFACSGEALTLRCTLPHQRMVLQRGVLWGLNPDGFIKQSSGKTCELARECSEWCTSPQSMEFILKADICCNGRHNCTIPAPHIHIIEACNGKQANWMMMLFECISKHMYRRRYDLKSHGEVNGDYCMTKEYWGGFHSSTTLPTMQPSKTVTNSPLEVTTAQVTLTPHTNATTDTTGSEELVASISMALVSTMTSTAGALTSTANTTTFATDSLTSPANLVASTSNSMTFSANIEALSTDVQTGSTSRPLTAVRSTEPSVLASTSPPFSRLLTTWVKDATTITQSADDWRVDVEDDDFDVVTVVVAVTLSVVVMICIIVALVVALCLRRRHAIADLSGSTPSTPYRRAASKELTRASSDFPFPSPPSPMSAGSLVGGFSPSIRAFPATPTLERNAEVTEVAMPETTCHSTLNTPEVTKGVRFSRRLDAADTAAGSITTSSEGQEIMA